jgi:hypothetical protein
MWTKKASLEHMAVRRQWIDLPILIIIGVRKWECDYLAID